MKRELAILLTAVAFMPIAFAQSGRMGLPKTVEAGAPFSFQPSGSGKATLYVVGPSQALKRDVLLGQVIDFPAGTLYNAGHYLAVLVGDFPTESDSFDVVPASKPASLNLLARPSRLQVGLHGAITGAAYVLDAWGNLITAPTQISFELKSPTGSVQSRTVTTHHGAAFTEMDSTAEQGIDRFVARVGDVSSTRVVGQVPGDPCGLKMAVKPAGTQLELQTDQVRDCSGNAVPDGTIVTFTASYNGAQTTVDVPLKRGIAQIEMPAHPGATISVASGVVLGNQIRVEKKP